MRIGVIGYGMRGAAMMKLLKGVDPRFQCAAIYDINSNAIPREGLEDTVFYDSADEMLEHDFDAFIIATYCNAHTAYAVRVMQKGVPLFLEKPVSVNDADLELLSKANREWNRDNVVVSFPLRHSPMVTWVKETVQSGKIGAVDHIQAIDNVPYGRNYFHKWFRFEELAGGLFLQKATHDFDYINYILGGQKPVEVCAMTSKQYYKGDMPPGLKCSDCEKKETCRENPENVVKWSSDTVRGEWCCFAEDCANEDSGSALVRYESGMHLSYSQNFIARKKAAARGARFIGYEGTVEFNWETQTASLFMHHKNIVEHVSFHIAAEHGGGDAALVRNFADIIKGKAKSETSLDDGILSALMCIRAKQSARERVWKEIDYKKYL